MQVFREAGREAAGWGAAGVSAALALLRGRRRAFHPRGCCFRARLEVLEGEPLATGLLPAGCHPAVVRLSKAAGLPAGWPDVLGVAVKVEAGAAVLDLLLNSCGPGAVGKYVMLPAQRYFERPYTSLSWYRIGDEEVMVGLLPPPGPGPTFEELRRTWNLDGAAFDVVVASRRLGWDQGSWRHAGWLILGEPFPEGESLVFDGLNVPGPAVPAGFLNSLRPWAYPASRHVRRVRG